MKAIVLGRAEWLILLGVPVLWAAGPALHFLYPLSGGALLAGLLAPVNESVWEHLKLVLWPMALWWTACYLRAPFRRELDAPSWFAAALGAILAAQGFIVLAYYFCAGALGVHSAAADIALFFLAAVLGQWAGLRLYQRRCALSWAASLAALAALPALFAVCTLAPPDLPLFCDPVTGTRGIFQW